MKKQIVHSETPKEIAKEAGLRYVTDEAPGITRKKSGKSFIYFDERGKQIKNKKSIDRINALAIPPAYKHVWICPNENGHIQATGRDARGRKQYRYHAKWNKVRDGTKYDKLIPFGYALPKIRRTTRKHLSMKGLPKEKVLATVVQLLDKTHIRVGNEEYAHANNSYGLTTMRVKHVAVKGNNVEFAFTGKSGVKHDIKLDDVKLAKIIKECHELPGYELFQYKNENGDHHTIKSEDVNAYIKTLTGEDFTAKNFRTWHGTILACGLLHKSALPKNITQAKKEVVKAVEAVAKELGNTKAVSRKAYIHPHVIESFMDGTLDKALKAASKSTDKKLRALGTHEATVVAFLKNKAT